MESDILKLQLPAANTTFGFIDYIAIIVVVKQINQDTMANSMVAHSNALLGTACLGFTEYKTNAVLKCLEVMIDIRLNFRQHTQILKVLGLTQERLYSG